MNEITDALDEEIKSLKEECVRKDRYVMSLLERIDNLRKSSGCPPSVSLNENVNMLSAEVNRLRAALLTICTVDKTAEELREIAIDACNGKDVDHE